jgi:hypothetical protein
LEYNSTTRPLVDVPQDVAALRQRLQDAGKLLVVDL